MYNMLYGGWGKAEEDGRVEWWDGSWMRSRKSRRRVNQILIWWIKLLYCHPKERLFSNWQKSERETTGMSLWVEFRGHYPCRQCQGESSRVGSGRFQSSYRVLRGLRLIFRTACVSPPKGQKTTSTTHNPTFNEIWIVGKLSSWTWGCNLASVWSMPKNRPWMRGWGWDGIFCFWYRKGDLARQIIILILL